MDADRLRGLTEEEAARRLKTVGPNEAPRGRQRRLLDIVVETMREPMFLLLIGAALLYMFLGDLGEGLFLFAGATAAIGLVIFQESRSERALASLRDLAQPFARVIRDGVDTKIPARELVPGDLLLVGEGERLQADGALVAGDVLSVDESMLTGESAPVAKHPASGDPPPDVVPGNDAGPHVFAGTMVVAGQGVVRIARTGASSALGKISTALAAIGHEPTPLQKTTGRVVTLIGFVALVFCGLVAVSYGLLRGDWVGGLLAGITIAIALVPEEFPMVLAIFLALGAWRLATHKVLVRRSAVVETLGGTTVLCVDKTGTLTKNRMKVARLWAPSADIEINGETSLPDAGRKILALACLASSVRPVDPMDRALRALSDGLGETSATAAQEPDRVWPLRPERLAVVQLWTQPTGRRIAAAKGAPEAIFALCRLPAGERDRLHQVILSYAEQGLRVLGIASAPAERPFDEPRDLAFEFAGLVGFIDPLRQDVPQALREARGAGIKVAMITGDHPATALAIARLAGIDVTAGVLTGAEVAQLSFTDLCARLKRVRIFARIAPEQKLRIVEAFKADGEIVAMTGDGVNDAPALEAAHIGIAMGKKGTDVAREAADLVLQDDSFASIVGGVRMGRRIFGNLRRAMIFITAIHVPIAGMALIPILMGLPQLLFPMHVVLLELVIDPLCALVFEIEPSDRNAMQRPPRRRDESLFGLRQIMIALVQGMGVLAGVLGVYWWASIATGETEARATAFVALVTGVLVLALADSAVSNRIFAPHRRIFWLIVLAVAVVLALVLFVPALTAVFSFSTPEPRLLILAVAVGLVSGGWTVLGRLHRPKRPASLVAP
ncbi:MAG: cation-translocating P-type ATPase [Hyphomonadaceae bacterium]|nr:cation-translocating P-type ATPase [Hyphomonadaceae bacterium]